MTFYGTKINKFGTYILLAGTLSMAGNVVSLATYDPPKNHRQRLEQDKEYATEHRKKSNREIIWMLTSAGLMMIGSSLGEMKTKKWFKPGEEENKKNLEKRLKKFARTYCVTTTKRNYELDLNNPKTSRALKLITRFCKYSNEELKQETREKWIYKEYNFPTIEEFAYSIINKRATKNITIENCLSDNNFKRKKFVSKYNTERPYQVKKIIYEKDLNGKQKQHLLIKDNDYGERKVELKQLLSDRVLK